MDEPAEPQATAGLVVETPRSRRFIFVMLMLLIGAALWLAWPFRAAVVLALFLGYIFHGPYRRLVKVVRFPAVAASIVLIVVAVGIFGPLAFFTYRMIDESGGVIEALQAGALQNALASTMSGLGIEFATAQEIIDAAALELAARVQAAAIGVVSGALSFVLSLLVFFLILFYILVDGGRLVSAFHRYVPLSPVRREALLVATSARVRAIVLGSFAIYALQGVVAGIGWWLLGFPSPVFWGVLMTVLAVLPFLGPQIVMIPAGIWAISQGNTFAGVALIIYSLVGVSLIDDVVRPWFIAKRAGVHPALVLVGTLGGLQVFGIAGILLGPLLLGLVGPILESWSGAPPAPPAPVERRLFRRHTRRAS